MDKKFIYIPSLSAGGYKQYLIEDKILVHSGINSRFYSDDFPENFRYKNFLLTAGHLYKKKNIREEMGLEDSFVFGDSGGFQFASGAKVFDKTIRHELFTFLEGNCDIAANLDIPPKMTLASKFDECLELSIDNFKYFYDNQSGKVKYLNILHGTTPEQFIHWYDGIKDFEFSGWATGTAFKLVNWMYTLHTLISNREFEKISCEYFHIFGVSSPFDFLIAAKIQECINKYHDGRVTITVDSSSPGLGAVYGYYYHHVDYNKQSFKKMRFFKGNDIVYPDAPLPCTIGCPACKNSSIKHFNTYDTMMTNHVVLHNTLIFAKAAADANDLIKVPSEVLEVLVGRNIIKILKSIELMFVENSLHVYNKFKQLYLKYGGDHESEQEVKHNFFNFN